MDTVTLANLLVGMYWRVIASIPISILIIKLIRGNKGPRQVETEATIPSNTIIIIADDNKVGVKR